MAFIACLSVLLGAASANDAVPPSAVPPSEGVAEAQRLFKAGALAYKLGKFGTAVQAFEQAHDLAPNPALRFSAAQALRRQYAADRRRELLDRARRYYDGYLSAVGQGRRRLDAAKAIEKIDLLLAANHPAPEPPAPTSPVEPDDVPDGEAPNPVVAPTGPPPAPPAPEPETSLIVESPVASAQVQIDGEPPQPMPLIRELSPGRHRLLIQAAGYRPVERTVELITGKVKSLDVPLEALPAALTIRGPAGLDVVIDGRPMGRTPLANAVELRAGDHQVVAGTNGHQVFEQRLSLDRGQAKAVEVEVSMTTQRVASWVLLGSAGVLGAGSVGLTIAALVNQGDAKDLLAKAAKEERPLTVDEAEKHNAALSRRDNLRRISGITIAAASLAAGVGLLTFIFDEPHLYGVGPSDETEEGGDDKAAPRGLGVSAAPLVSPSVLAVGLWGHF